MDPSATLSIAYDSLEEDSPMIDPIVWYIVDQRDTLTRDFRQISSNIELVSGEYKMLKEAKRELGAIDDKVFIEARDATNPFEGIGRSIFMNRAAIKLANIDAVFNVSGKKFNFVNKTSDQPFIFADIAAGPGGFTQYLQYRFPKSVGYGMTIKHKILDWNTRRLDMSRFYPYYGKDKTGDLYTNWEEFIEYVLKQTTKGCDLVTADGGFDLEDNKNEHSEELLQNQEFLSSRLFLIQAIIGIACVRIGGNFVLKTFDTVTNISAQVIFVLAQCFEKITLFKPISSRPANAEKYLICVNKKENNGSYYQLLTQAANAYTNEIFLTNIFSNELPTSFIDWLTKINNQSTERQLMVVRNILTFVKGDVVDIPEYSIHKFLIIWNLPETPIRKPIIRS